jgi:hypothetical protein
MKVEDALKKSNTHTIYREEEHCKVFIHYLPYNQGILMTRIFPTRKSVYGNPTDYKTIQETYPHLGALLNDSRQKGYHEIRRYADDWQPQIHFDELVTEEDQEWLESQEEIESAPIGYVQINSDKWEIDWNEFPKSIGKIEYDYYEGEYEDEDENN